MMTEEIISPFEQVFAHHHELARRWKKEGKRVLGYIYAHVPIELISSAGIIPVQLTEGEDRRAYSAGKTYFPDYYCDYVACCLGQALTGEYDYLDGLVLPDACETLRGLAGEWQTNVETPLFFINYCGEDNEGTRAFYRRELALFQEALEGFCGQSISRESLQTAIEASNKNKALLKSLSELRQREDFPLGERQFVDMFRAGLVIPKEEHNRMLEESLPQLARLSGGARSGPRLLVSYFLFEECIKPDGDIIAMIEELGGNIVADDLLFGARYFWQPFELKDDPMEALVQGYLGKIPMAFKYPRERRVDMLLKLARSSQAQGAIFIVPKYCTCYLWECPYIEAKFNEEGIACLLLETVEEMPALTTMTRLEAFIEMLAAP